jgi:hypothetical protein
MMLIDLVDSVPSSQEDLAKIVSVFVTQLPGVVLVTALMAVKKTASIQKKGRCDAELGRGRITTVVAGADQA